MYGKATVNVLINLNRINGKQKSYLQDIAISIFYSSAFVTRTYSYILFSR